MYEFVRIKIRKYKSTKQPFVLKYMDLLGVWFHHDVTVDKDGANDGEWEQWMRENMDRNPEIWVNVALKHI